MNSLQTFLVSLSFLLVACAPAAPGGSSSSDTSVPSRPRAQEGELCGGIAGFQCDDGLVCRYDGTYPDAAGTCVRDA